MAKKKVTNSKADVTPANPEDMTVDALEAKVALGGTGLKGIVEIVRRSKLDWPNENERSAARHALRRAFGSILERGEMRKRPDSSSEEIAAVEWLNGAYKSHLDDLVDWTWSERSSNSERVGAMRTVLWLLAREHFREVDGLNGVSGNEDGNQSTKPFNIVALQTLLEKGTRTQLTAQDLVLRTLREEFVQAFVDFQFHYAKALLAVFNSTRKQRREEDGFSISAAFLLLCIIPLPKLKPLSDDEQIPLFVEDQEMEAKLRKVGPLRKAFQGAWLSFLRLRTLSGPTFKAVLTKLPQVIPYMSQPLLLSDFLSDCFSTPLTNHGDNDEIPLLALSSLFLLVRDYGLDYPQLYERLYELVRPSLFFSDKRESFCVLLDACLRSSHLPAYLIAAFCKKLARVALLSTPPAALFALAEIYNLLRRHPNCVFLIHRLEGKPSQLLHREKNEEQAKELDEIKEASRRLAMGLPFKKQSSLQSDPFIYEEKDPEKSRATESSLWELESLKNHYAPSVASLAKSVFAHDLAKDRLTKPELPLADFVVSYQDLYDQEARLRKQADEEGHKRVKVEAPLNARPPSETLFQKDTFLFASSS